MKKKIFCIVICMLLSTTVLTMMASSMAENIKNGNTNPTCYDGFILDQYQTETGSFVAVLKKDVWVAQSFKPTMTPLVKVRLFIDSDENAEQPLEVSIRKELDGEDLTYVSIEPNLIPTTRTWVNFEFPDITVEPDETYYIVTRTQNEEEAYYWFQVWKSDINYYERGNGWWINPSSSTWENLDDYYQYFDFCFKTYSYTGREPDLSCSGSLNFEDVPAGGTVMGSFNIENVGDPESLLNWEIAEYPDWGTWSFSLNEGYDITPEDEPLNIEVTIIADNEQNKDFTGEIKIVNKDDTNDYDTIQVSIKTPRNRAINNPFDIFHKNYPYLFSLLKILKQRLSL